MNGRIPDWMLERYALGELPENARAELGRRLEEDAEARARLAALEAENRDFLARHPPSEMGPRILARLHAEARPRNTGHFRLVYAAAAASLALGLFFALENDDGEVRTKGLLPSLVVHRSVDGRVERLVDGATAGEGDLVQLSYVAAGRRFGVIFSIDGAGEVSLHLPLRGVEAVPLEPGSAVALSHAYELDDAPAFERFFFVVSDAPFRLSPILEAARSLPEGESRLPLPGDFEQATFLLRKP